MIDKLVMRCRFKDIETFDLKSVGLPLQGEIDGDSVTDLYHRWESIPSSFSTLAFKIFDHVNVKNERDCYVEIKASPAKLMQGHNVFGSDNLEECALALLDVFYETYPEIAGQLSTYTWEIVEADVTFHSRAETTQLASQFIQAMQNVSNGHTRARHGYASTSYFGKKDSRLKKIKVYEKYLEVINYLKKCERKKDYSEIQQIYTDQLIEYSKGLIRWEVTLKKRWFERRNIPTQLIKMIKIWDSKTYWLDAMGDLFKALEGTEMKLNTDQEIENKLKAKYFAINKHGTKTFTKALGAYRTYLLIKKIGYIETEKTMSRMAMWRYIKMLQGIGISIAALQNLHTSNGVVIPMVRYITVDFEKQMPDWAQA